MSKKIMFTAMALALVAALVGGATMAWFSDGGEAGQAEFTAGTVLVEGNTSVIYGVEYKEPESQKGTLYEIFIDNDTVTYAKLYDSNKTALNALAFDRKNKRLYYADGNGNLFFYDFNDGVGDKAAGKVFTANTKIFNAAFGLGHYWFVKENTDDLYKISFNPNGTIAQVILAHGDFTGTFKRSFGFGDIAMEMRDGIIYGSTSSFGGSFSTFFTYNVSTGVYTEYAAGAKNMQLAFGADGALYGTVTRDLDWYRVNTGNGTQTWFYKSDKMFGDLASNFQNNWNPGDCDIVRYRARNVGTKNQYVRIKLSGSWDFVGYDPGVVDFKLCEGDPENNHWQRVGSTFYYKGVLEPGQTTPPLCVLVCLSGPDTDNDYQGKTFSLSAVIEAIQSSNNAYLDPVFDWQGYPK